ncbi:MAG: phosphoribosyl-AMP cyclohydrolase [Patescibacteria group bacterium]
MQPSSLISPADLSEIFLDESQLLPVIVQEDKTGEVLMLAYTNRQALLETFKTKLVHFFSRSRKSLWKKGETSGNYLQLRSLFFDCDNDAILLKVKMLGGCACHTGEKSCFFRRMEVSDEP